MIIVVDYKMGNHGSIINMLKKIGYKAVFSSDIDEISQADKLILPGVGSFDNGMRNLAELNLIEVLNDRVINKKTPVIGICLGMQLLTDRSEEGRLPGLGWIKGETVRFRFDNELAALKIPHMGWNTVKFKDNCTLYSNPEEEVRFYFVHSYHVVCSDVHDIAGTTHYGYEFASVIKNDNIVGVQFHPEKSHRFGMKLLKEFLELS